jgi:multicomponent Na+:H+ antiporter subunit D
VKEAPVNMLVAMAVAAAACLALGIAPGFLYAILPYYPVDYAPYTATHIVTQFQLLVLAALAVAVLLRVGLYPTPGHAVYLDFDWTYRTALPWAARTFVRHGGAVWQAATRQCLARLDRVTERLYRHHGPEGVFARTWPTGTTVLWVAILLAAYLVIYSV